MAGEARITSRSAGGAGVVVAVAGELDMGRAQEFEAKLLAAIGSPATSVLIDLTDCDFVDSTALNVLVKAHNAVDGTSSRIALVAPGPGILKVLEITHLDHVFTIHPSRASALADSSASPGPA